MKYLTQDDIDQLKETLEEMEEILVNLHQRVQALEDENGRRKI